MIFKLSFILWITFYSVDSGLWRHNLHFSHSHQFVYSLVVAARAFGVISKKWLPNPVLRTFALCFLTGVKTSSRSLIHFELILYIVLGRGPTSSFGRWTFRVFLAPFVENTDFSPWNSLGSPVENLWPNTCVHAYLFSRVWAWRATVHGVSQARILKWVPISFSRGSFWPRDRTWVSWVADGFFTVGATREDHTWGFKSTCFILSYWCAYLCLCQYHTFAYCSFIGSFGIRKCESSSFVLFEDYLGYLGSLRFHMYGFFYFCKKVMMILIGIALTL